MIPDIEPVANIAAIAIDGQRLAAECIVNDQRNELLRKLVGAVVVGAVGGERRQPIGVMVGPHQMIGGRLGSRIRAVGRIGRGFGKRGVGRSERTVDFVRGHMQEAKRVPVLAVQSIPVGTHRFQQIESANNIGLDEFRRAMDRAIHMALGGKIDYCTGPMLQREAYRSARDHLYPQGQSDADCPLRVWPDWPDCPHKSACPG